VEVGVTQDPDQLQKGLSANEAWLFFLEAGKNFTCKAGLDAPLE
jgi:hypothetical protein